MWWFSFRNKYKQITSGNDDGRNYNNVQRSVYTATLILTDDTSVFCNCCPAKQHWHSTTLGQN